MIDQKEANRISDEFHEKVRGQFEKQNLKVLKLDNDNKGRKSDYLVENSNKDSFICECKFIASAGAIDSGKFLASTLDRALLSKGFFQSDTGYEKTGEIIGNACQQYKSLIEKHPSFSKFPFVIALKFDELADCVSLIKKDIFGFKEVSALMVIKRDLNQTMLAQDIAQRSLAELKKIINREIHTKMPPESVHFCFLHNSQAKIKFCPNKFFVASKYKNL